MRILPRTLWLVATLMLISAAPAQGPLNLSTAKAAVLRYVDAGCYEKDLAVEAAAAHEWIELRGSQRVDGERLAIVLDIDETTLSNLPHMRAMDFGYVPASWDLWVAEATAPAIEPVKQIFLTARQYGVTVFFITGRKESDRPGTDKNLDVAGMGDHERLICKPSDFPGTSESYKIAARERLTADGWTIIANVGDQESDLRGGFSEKTFKLVNPFYIIE